MMTAICYVQANMLIQLEYVLKDLLQPIKGFRALKTLNVHQIKKEFMRAVIAAGIQTHRNIAIFYLEIKNGLQPEQM
jgi:hypothetical protein